MEKLKVLVAGETREVTMRAGEDIDAVLARAVNEPENPGDAVPPVAALNEPDPAKVARELHAANEMQARMMWGIKRGVNPKDVGSLKALRDMNRKQRRAALAQAGKRVRKTRSAG